MGAPPGRSENTYRNKDFRERALIGVGAIQFILALLHCRPDRVQLPRALALVTERHGIAHPLDAVSNESIHLPELLAILDAVANGYDQALRVLLGSISVPEGSRVAVVDFYNAFKGRNGLLLIQKKNGVTGPGPFDIEVHPTNAGHTVMAQEFERAWNALPLESVQPASASPFPFRLTR